MYGDPRLQITHGLRTTLHTTVMNSVAAPDLRSTTQRALYAAIFPWLHDRHNSVRYNFYALPRARALRARARAKARGTPSCALARNASPFPSHLPFCFNP